MEICNKCGSTIKLNCIFEKPWHLFENEFYCDKCLDEVEEEFCLSED